MKHLSRRDIKYFSGSVEFFEDLLRVISRAERSIFLETYRLNGSFAVRLKDVLIKKAKEGVVVKLLLDHWGSLIREDFFSELEALGGEVRFFRVFKFTTNVISYNNRRDHRKLVVVDDFCYIGSANLTSHSKDWREFVVRIRDSVFADKMRMIFIDNFKIHDFFFHSPKNHLSPLRFESLEVVRDVPSIRYQKIRNKMLHLIRNAKSRVVIETPYFVPDAKMILGLIRAARRGVDVSIIIPKRSDVRLVDILTQSLLGELHRRGVKIFLFSPGFSHAKVGLFDDFFYFGSANFDYRSFKYQYELGVFGKNRVLGNVVEDHLRGSFSLSKNFDFARWKRRSLFFRALEVLLEPFRHFF